MITKTTRNKSSILVAGLLIIVFLISSQRRDDILSELFSIDENVEDDNLIPEDYDHKGCPIVPIAFSGMTGRLGNIISTYVNFIALQYKVGYKYHLPLYMNMEPVNLTRPYLTNIFKNVSFPTATWSNFSNSNYRDAAAEDVMLFSNSRTGFNFTDCHMDYMRHVDVEPLFSDLYKCVTQDGCTGKRCTMSDLQCGYGNIWITVGTGTNYPDFNFIGSVLQEIIQDHLQFTDHIISRALASMNNVETQLMQKKNVQTLYNHHHVGVHVRRADYHQYSKFWMPELLNETFYLSAMSYIRSKHESVSFLILSDDQDWCRAHLKAPDVFYITGNPPAVDMAIMSLSNSTIIDYGTYSLWGAILSGGEVVISKKTFRDARWAADYFKWTYM